MAFINKYDIPFHELKDLIPIEINFDFGALLDYYNENGFGKDNPRFMETIEAFKNNDKINKPFKDSGLIAEFSEEIKALFAPLFPEMLQKNEIKSLVFPFDSMIVNPTQRLAGILDSAGKPENVKFLVDKNKNPYTSSGVLILNWYYGAGIDYANQYYFEVTNDKTGETRYYRSLMNADFMKITKKPDAPEITPEDIQLLIDNFTDVELWMEKLPPQSYICEGFGLMTWHDNTVNYQESMLKDLLLQNDVLDNPKMIGTLKNLLSSYFGIPDLEIGVVAYDHDADRIKPMGFGIFQSLLLDNKEESCSISEMGLEVVSQLKEKTVAFSSNYDDLSGNTCNIQSKLEKHKEWSYGLFPLMVDGKLIAIVEMLSKKTKQLNQISAKKFESIEGVFSTSINRYLKEFDIRLEAIIKEKCTAIHPTVEWRFRQDADRYYKNLLIGNPAEMIDIDFEKVYPLYGQIDIKDSSIKRNSSITTDLKRQLKSLVEILDLAYAKSRLPYFDQLLYKTKKRYDELSLGINVGDEISILDFIHYEVENTFSEITTLHKDLETLIDQYNKDKYVGTDSFNHRRASYESSVQSITRTITSMMEERQEVAQRMFPHYYEKYKTDGIEHNIYIGQSLVNNRPYHALYLRNLRLWQLMSIIEIENQLQIEYDELEVPLKVCSLVLVHSNPITIRFRMDEKKFDVEGAYNIRYEIIKKRIDKSLIVKSKERLTQPGKISIVYAQSEEGREYRTYLEYLTSIGYLKNDIEQVDLMPLQGISGLKALRASINFQPEEKLEASLSLMGNLN